MAGAARTIDPHMRQAVSECYVGDLIVTWYRDALGPPSGDYRHKCATRDESLHLGYPSSKAVEPCRSFMRPTSD